MYIIALVDGDSMNPTIKGLNLIVINKDSEPSLNDIIVYRDKVHRVVNSYYTDEQVYITKPDNGLYYDVVSSDEIKGVVVQRFSIPFI